MNPACLTAFAASTRPTTLVTPPVPMPEQHATETTTPTTILQTITPYIPWFARSKDELTTSLRAGGQETQIKEMQLLSQNMLANDALREDKPKS